MRGAMNAAYAVPGRINAPLRVPRAALQPPTGGGVSVREGEFDP